jgi:hypothetical protein
MRTVRFAGATVEKGLKVVGLATFVVTLFTLSLAVVAIVQLFSAADDAQDAKLASQIVACRSEARVSVDDAISQFLSAEAALDEATNRLVDNPQDETARLGAALARRELAAAATQVDRTTATYGEAIRLSVADPAAFVNECNG